MHTNVPIPTCIQTKSTFTYLGITIYKNIHKINRDNFNTNAKQNKIRQDIHRWRNLKTSLQGRINTVKMNILPHLNFLFFTPSLPPPNYFKYILSMISILSMMGFILDGRWPWVCLNCSDPNCWVAGTLLLVISDQSI